MVQQKCTRLDIIMISVQARASELATVRMSVNNDIVDFIPSLSLVYPQVTYVYQNLT